MVKTRSALTFVTIAAALAACGSTASADSKGAARPVATMNKPGPCNDLPGMLVEPKATPATPTATSCWADGMFVGNGSLKSKQIIFASKEADLMQYEATSAMFANPTAWAAWKQQASQYIDAKGITSESAQLAILLNKHQTFALPPGDPVVNSGFQKTAPAECQSSVVLAKNEPSPQYLVEERDIKQTSVTNGQLSRNTVSVTDVLAQFGQNFRLIGILSANSQVPPCVG